jgi:type VI secretion system secreted protein Hcp
MKLTTVCFFVTLLLAATGRAWAAAADNSDIVFFLKVDGIGGESTVVGHANEIDVLAYSTGASNNSSTHTGGGAGAGKVNFQDLSLTKYVDGTSPLFLLACATGQHFNTAELKGARRSKNGVLQDYLTVKLTNVIVTSISSGGTAGDLKQIENITLNFAKIELTVRKANSDGTLGAPVTISWNIATNTSS